jgi:hypothetical protein
MLRGRAAAGLALLAACALGACGGARPSAGPAVAPPEEEGTAVDDPGAFPEEPLLREDFAAGAGRWPQTEGRAQVVGGSYRISLDGTGALLTSPAPLTVEPGTAGVLVEAEVTLRHGSGSAGLFCRGVEGRQTFYALTLDAAGDWALRRFEDGAQRVLDSGTLPATVTSEPGEPSLLRLACGTGTGGVPVSLAFTVNASPFLSVRDPQAVDPGGPSRVGVVALGAHDGTPFEAGFDNVAVWLAEPAPQ